MITTREHYTGELFTIDYPTALSSKPGVVLASQGHYETNYMSIPGDKWVSSRGDILTCEQLFDELNTKGEDTKLIWLTDYDFQGMYEVKLANKYYRLCRIVEEQEVPVFDPATKTTTNIKYQDLLKPGTVVRFNRYKHYFCIKFGHSLLEGSWVDDEGQCRSTAEFLFYVLEEGDEAIWLVND